MRYQKKILISAIAIASATIIANQPGKVSPYPNPQLTPGKAETLNFIDLTRSWNGQTYSQYHREVSTALHKKVYDEYNVPQDKRNIANGEVDHFYPLCAGGSNDISNLWYEPIKVIVNGEDWGFKKKDKLEAEICRQIKAGKIDPHEAYQKLTKDWIAYYKELNLDAKLGSVTNEVVE